MENRLESINEILNENALKLSNLVSLVEAGSALRSISARIKELEDIQEKLEEEQRRLKRSRPPTLDPDRITKAITQFFGNFERSFDQLSIQERKEMLRRMVERILVDREQRKVRCYLRRLPIIANITDNIDSYYLGQGLSGVALRGPQRSPSKNVAEFQGAACSPNGDRTRISALRGPRPKPLDDRARTIESSTHWMIDSFPDGAMTHEDLVIESSIDVIEFNWPDGPMNK